MRHLWFNYGLRHVHHEAALPIAIQLDLCLVDIVLNRDVIDHLASAELGCCILQLMPPAKVEVWFFRVQGKYPCHLYRHLNPQRCAIFDPSPHMHLRVIPFRDPSSKYLRLQRWGVYPFGFDPDRLRCSRPQDLLQPWSPFLHGVLGPVCNPSCRTTRPPRQCWPPPSQIFAKLPWPWFPGTGGWPSAELLWKDLACPQGSPSVEMLPSLLCLLSRCHTFLRPLSKFLLTAGLQLHLLVVRPLHVRSFVLVAALPAPDPFLFIEPASGQDEDGDALTLTSLLGFVVLLIGVRDLLLGGLGGCGMWLLKTSWSTTAAFVFSILSCKDSIPRLQEFLLPHQLQLRHRQDGVLPAKLLRILCRRLRLLRAHNRLVLRTDIPWTVRANPIVSPRIAGV